MIPAATAARERGYILFESLISVLVVSIGFLAFAGLQVSGLAASSSALLRSKAVYLTYQMTDRMRANRPATEAGAYDALTGAASNPGCIVTGCTPAQMAQTDFAEWTAEVAALLPNGSAIVCIDSTPDDGDPGAAACDNSGDSLAIKIWWVEKGSTTRFSTAFRP
jgi:type IV pilus assembly protein PilV